MHRLFLLVKVRERRLDPLPSQDVQDLSRYARELLNFLVELFALFAHELTVGIRRKRAALSVTTAELRAVNAGQRTT
jgi:hypothetical protein